MTYDQFYSKKEAAPFSLNTAPFIEGYEILFEVISAFPARDFISAALCGRSELMMCVILITVIEDSIVNYHSMGTTVIFAASLYPASNNRLRR